MKAAQRKSVPRRELERAATSPGEHIREFLSLAAITQDDFAIALGVTRLSVNQLVNGKRSITPDMAMRLAALTEVSARFWLTIQMNYDLWCIEQRWACRGDLQHERKRIEGAAKLFKKRRPEAQPCM